MSLPISSIGLRYRNALWSACSASLYSRNALSIAFASAGVMNNDITAQATASRQIAQRLRASRRNCPTTAARRSAAPPAPNGVGEGSVQRSHRGTGKRPVSGRLGRLISARVSVMFCILSHTVLDELQFHLFMPRLFRTERVNVKDACR